MAGPRRRADFSKELLGLGALHGMGNKAIPGRPESSRLREREGCEWETLAQFPV